nr:hypothetical protein HK105_005709 [Polyrhizophydium stewartii]
MRGCQRRGSLFAWYAGLRLAAAHINQDSTVLPDATIEIVREPIFDFTNAQDPALYDRAQQICRQPGYMGVAPDMGSRSVVAFMTMCGQSYFPYFSQQGINVIGIAGFPQYRGPGLYYPQLQQTFEFLKSTRCRILIAVCSDTDLPDVMMAANQTGIKTPDYGGAFDPSVMQSLIFFVSGFADDFSANPFWPAFKARFEAAVTQTILYDSAWYSNLNPNETDPTQLDYQLNMFYDDIGIWKVPANYIRNAYNALWALSRAWDTVINTRGTTAEAVVNGSLINQGAMKLSYIVDQTGSPDANIGDFVINDRGNMAPYPKSAMQMDSNGRPALVGRIFQDENEQRLRLELLPSFRW